MNRPRLPCPTGPGISRIASAAALAAAVCSAGPHTAHAGPRVITLAPHATEMVYAAGAGDRIVGTVNSSDFPAEARALPRVGDGIQLNAERILVLRPTVLVAWLRSGAALGAEDLAGRIGATMVYSHPRTLRDIPEDVRRLGALLGTREAAAHKAAEMDARIDALEAEYAGRRKVRVFIEAGSRPLYTIGADPLTNDALRICGAANIYGTAIAPAPRVPIEGVLVQNPELIVAPARDGRDAVEIRSRWAGYGLHAAQAGRIHLADPDALFRPGPRFIDATADLCAAVDRVRADTEK